MSLASNSPLMSSDDSAVGSSSGSNRMDRRQTPCEWPEDSHQPARGASPPMPKEKCDRAFLLRRLVRTELPHLNAQQYVSKSCHSIKFQSAGRLDGSLFVPRPMSILWPDSEMKTISELQKLDSYLVDTNFVLNPVEWMLANNLTSKPECKHCKKDMILIHNDDTAIWHCTMEFVEHCALVQRPTCFKGFEDVDLIKLLFAIYHWSICSPFEYVVDQMKLEPKTARLIWHCLQRVCNTALEKSYPRYRLYSNPDGNSQLSEPVDLIFIKLNKTRIVCGKQPKLNCVRLCRFNGQKIPVIIQSWFAHGAQVRVCQSRFLDLKKTRTDLDIKLVPLAQMVLKNGVFDQESAFGYLLSLLTNALKEFDTSTLSDDVVKYLLAEAEWREFHGTTPYDAFKNIVHHISQYFKPTDFHFDAVESEDSCTLRSSQQQTNPGALEVAPINEPPPGPEEVFVESYYYATIEPYDKKTGKLLRKAPEHYVNMPPSDVKFLCHHCSNRYESFDFCWHMIAHIEDERKGQDRRTLTGRGLMECKHCFRVFARQELLCHKELTRMDSQRAKFGCRICCLQLKDETQFLGHMTKFHAEHETPYKCPGCPFASSFQREVFVHFQEEHRHEYVLLCPICLRSFTIAEPGRLATSMSRTVSQKIYNHLDQHHTLASRYSCDSCCLSFLQSSHLRAHKEACHDSARRSQRLANETGADWKLFPYQVTKDEQQHCVVAKMKDLKDAQAQNIAMEQQDTESTAGTYQSSVGGGSVVGSVVGSVGGGGDAREDTPSCHGSEYLTTNEIIDYLSKLDRTSEFIPEELIVLTPTGLPAKCVECMQYVTDYHYKSTMQCKYCSYKTHCPQAADNHHVLDHNDRER